MAAAYTTNYFCPGTSLHSVTLPPTLPRTLYQVLTPTILRQTAGLRYQRRGKTLTGYSVGSKVRYFTPRIYGPAPRKLTASFREPYLVTRVRAPSLTSIDKFGKELMIPPALQQVPPVKRDIAERIPLPASTGSPLDPTENEVIRRRNERAERGRTTELYRLDLPDEFRLPPRKEIVQEPRERGNLRVPVADIEIEDPPGTHKYPHDLPSTQQNPPLVKVRRRNRTTRISGVSGSSRK